MISQTAEYALRAVVWLAENEGKPQTTEQIAKGMRIPAGYLSKVMQTLGRAGMVTSQRGLHGGFTLATLPSQLSLLDVVNKVDPIQRIRECPLGRKSHGKNLCGLHYRIDAALALIEDAFRNTTIEDLCTDVTMNPPVCTEEASKGKRNKKK